jgi:hypothetical protein
MQLSKLIKFMAYLTFAEMFVMILALSYCLKLTIKDIRSRFFSTLCVILMLTDFCIAGVAFGDWLEATKYIELYPVWIAIEMGIVNFGFYGGANSVHWLFGFKYWVISKEMPKVVTGNL